jgi:hypothetical protein
LGYFCFLIWKAFGTRRVTNGKNNEIDRTLELPYFYISPGFPLLPFPHCLQNTDSSQSSGFKPDPSFELQSICLTSHIFKCFKKSFDVTGV